MEIAIRCLADENTKLKAELQRKDVLIAKLQAMIPNLANKDINLLTDKWQNFDLQDRSCKVKSPVRQEQGEDIAQTAKNAAAKPVPEVVESEHEQEEEFDVISPPPQRRLVEKKEPVKEETKASLELVNSAGMGWWKHVKTLIWETHPRDLNAECRDEGGRTALIHACEDGRLDIIDRLIADAKADPLSKDWSGNSGLHMAAMKGHLQICKRLISLGADVNMSNNGGILPLVCAAFSGCCKTVRLLIREGAEKLAECPNGKTAYNYAKEKHPKNFNLHNLLK